MLPEQYVAITFTLVLFSRLSCLPLFCFDYSCLIPLFSTCFFLCEKIMRGNVMCYWTSFFWSIFLDVYFVAKWLFWKQLYHSFLSFRKWNFSVVFNSLYMGYLKILLFSEPSRQLWWYSLLSVSFVLFCLPIFVVLTKIFVYNLLWCNFPLVNGFARLNLVVGLDCFELWFCREVLLIGKWDLVHQLLEVSDSVYPVCIKFGRKLSES